MPELRLTLPSSDDPTELADWLEAFLLLSGRQQVSRAWIRGQLKNTVFIEDGIGIDDLDAGDLDVALDSLLDEMTRRRRATDKGYPFHIEKSTGTVRVDSDDPYIAYAFLLLISISPSMRQEARHSEVDRPFDLLALQAIRSYLGSSCNAIRFGAPASGERPASFARAVPWLARQLGLPLGKGQLRSHSGDGGADIVAWLPFRDDRHAFVVALAQCTVQLQWHNKGRDIVLDRWRGWIDTGKDPITLLAVPFAVPLGYERWDEIRRTTTVVMDRFRIARLASNIPDELRAEIGLWIAREARTLGAVTGAPILQWAS